MTIEVGDRAPDFALPDQHGRATALSTYDGPLLIVFFPAAFTPTCTSELAALREAPIPGVTVLAVSCDSVPALRAFADAERITFPVLSDFWPHGDVARAYGAFHPERGIAGRLSALVDDDGVVRAVWRSGPAEERDVADYARAAAALGTAPQDVRGESS